jgi:hypothetical protein
VLGGVEETSPILGNQASECHLSTEYKVTAHFKNLKYNHYHKRKCNLMSQLSRDSSGEKGITKWHTTKSFQDHK